VEPLSESLSYLGKGRGISVAGLMEQREMDTLVNRVADLIVSARKVVVFTGAGISTESGISDFRSPGGVWDRYAPDDFTYQKFVHSAEARKKHWQMLGEGLLTSGVEPNPAHYAVAGLDSLGRLDCVITQNADGLHQRAGVPEGKVFELHGNLQSAVCLGCGRVYPLERLRVRLEKGEEIPDCELCHGLLKPNAVLFGEALPRDVLQEATSRSYSCDLFMVIGSTLLIYPAAYIPLYAVQAGAKLVIINLSSTPVDGEAAVLIRAKAGEAMFHILKRVEEKMGGTRENT
jgi:NAD-dependent deacetylase